MKDFGTNFKAPSKKSVAAFFLLPQFHRGMSHFEHIRPAFLQILAVVLEQAGLLRPDHVALNFDTAGQASIRGIVGEAWANLRSQPRVTPYQYSIFSTVVGVIILAFMLPVVFLSNFMFGVGAQAQIFTNPIDGATDNIPAVSTSGLLTERALTSPDYAIDILNKVVRQGAIGDGGAMQVGLRVLLGTFNTAVLIIAAIVVFWAIISIVVDTARTGQLGGGRHNMVWTPIRFVWGLALIIPLGGGLSSGQFIVMKIAELGSNLGSRAWTNYVTSVAGTLVSDQVRNPEYQLELFVGLTRTLACQEIYNYYVAAQAQSMMATEQVDEYIFPGTTTGFERQVYTNRARTNLCGTVNIPIAGFTPALGADDSLPSGPSVTSMRTYRDTLLNAQRTAFDAQKPTARELARAFAMAAVPGFPAVSPTHGADANGTMPDAAVLLTMAGNFHDAYIGDVNSAASTLASAGNTTIVTEASDNGWADMGTFIQRIAGINSEINTAAQPSISVTPGTIIGMSTNPSVPEKGTSDALMRFDAWYKEGISKDSSASGTAAAVRDTSRDAVQEEGISGTGMGSNAITTVLNLVIDPNDMSFIVKIDGYGTDRQSYPLTSLVSVGSWMFHSAWGGYVGIATVMGASEAVKENMFAKLTMVAAGAANAVVGVMKSPFGALISTVLSMLLMAGAVLLFYVPILPFIKVLFAVMAWIVSVFEAVVMVPLVGLMHLNTEGEGLAGSAKGAYLLWLNILIRPILTVIGFVGALLVFSAMVYYMNHAFKESLNSVSASHINALFYRVAYSIIYVFMAYTLANASFKLVEAIPDAAAKWIGAQRDTQFNDSSIEGFINQGGRMMSGMSGHLQGSARNAYGRSRPGMRDDAMHGNAREREANALASEQKGET